MAKGGGGVKNFLKNFCCHLKIDFTKDNLSKYGQITLKFVGRKASFSVFFL